MKCVGLISGGKDSCYNLMQCVAEGHDIVALANLKPKDKDELDSYMYQSVGHHIIDLYAEALDLPLYRREITGTSLSTDKYYMPTCKDEVEDLYELLKEVKTKENIEAVSVGAILSNYQRVRVENVCQRLGLVPLAYLWRRDQMELLDEMIQCKLTAVLIKVAAMGLKPKVHLGKTLEEMREYLHKMNEDFELNVCGEGGEYETFTLDCPLFKKKIVLDETELVLHSDDAFAPVGYLNLKKAHLEDKNMDTSLSQRDMLCNLPLKTSVTLCDELFPNKSEIKCVEGYQCDVLTSNDIVNESLQPIVQAYNTEDTSHLSIVVSNIVGVMKNKDDSVLDIAKQCMDTLKQSIIPLDMCSIVFINLYVRNMADFAEINSVYKTYFGINPAARVCVEANLPQNVLLMLDCYANNNDSIRDTMHVQGLSHWAPANIGPYSQCVKIGDSYFVAGQIGMVPANLSLIEGGIHTQARLSLQHVCSVLNVMCPGHVHDITYLVCYITHSMYISMAEKELEKESSSLNLLCEPLFVVVPCLPKNALIEWQVIARTNLPKPINGSKYLSCGMNETSSIVFKSELSELYSLTTTVKCCVEPVDNLSTTINLIESQIKEITFSNSNKEDDKNKQIPLIRVFYKADILNFTDLYEGLKSRIKIPFSIIPCTEVSPRKDLALYITFV
ncbi:diphthine--ammonia ligase [Mactra antiquata]